ncbi:MAG: phosphoribosylformylglycinamidine synthase subunit PurS, partial [Endomicrobium sp.]|nr:phosphoribosylformylglycinamidine synthase subunit PurS [Endomicrobium sp.]
MFKIEILMKKGFKNSHGEHILSDICGIGIKNITKVEYSPLYVIDGDISSAEAETIAAELLSDKITETYTVNSCSQTNSDQSLNRIVEVWYKKGVTDTVSESIVKAVKDLGISKRAEVKTGHKYYLHGKISQTILNKIA